MYEEAGAIIRVNKKENVDWWVELFCGRDGKLALVVRGS